MKKHIYFDKCNTNLGEKIIELFPTVIEDNIDQFSINIDIENEPFSYTKQIGKLYIIKNFIAQDSAFIFIMIDNEYTKTPSVLNRVLSMVDYLLCTFNIQSIYAGVLKDNEMDRISYINNDYTQYTETKDTMIYDLFVKTCILRIEL